MAINQLTAGIAWAVGVEFRVPDWPGEKPRLFKEGVTTPNNKLMTIITPLALPGPFPGPPASNRSGGFGNVLCRDCQPPPLLIAYCTSGALGRRAPCEAAPGRGGHPSPGVGEGAGGWLQQRVGHEKETDTAGRVPTGWAINKAGVMRGDCLPLPRPRGREGHARPGRGAALTKKPRPTISRAYASEALLRRRRGNTATKVSRVEERIPPITTVASGLCTSAPTPWGERRRDETKGRHERGHGGHPGIRVRAPSSMASRKRGPRSASA